MDKSFNESSSVPHKVFDNIVVCLSTYHPLIRGGTPAQLAKRASYTTLDMFRRKGLTQEQIGERLGMTSTQVFRVIRYHEEQRERKQRETLKDKPDDKCNK